MRVLITYLRTNLLPIDNATKWVIVEYARRLSTKYKVSLLIISNNVSSVSLTNIFTNIKLLHMPSTFFVISRLYKALAWRSSSTLTINTSLAYYINDKLVRKLMSNLKSLVEEYDVILAHDLESAILFSGIDTAKVVYLAHDVYLYTRNLYTISLVYLIENKVVKSCRTGTLSFYDKFQLALAYNAPKCSYIGVGPIDYLHYTYSTPKSYSSPSAMDIVDKILNDNFLLAFATKGLLRKIVPKDERLLALTNVLALRHICKEINIPIVIIGSESRVTKMLLDKCNNVISLGFVDYYNYIKILCRASAIVLPLFGWRSGVSIKLLDALSYGNVVVTTYDAARAFPYLYTLDIAIRNLKEFVNTIRGVLKNEKLQDDIRYKLKMFRSKYLSWNCVLDRLSGILNV